MGIFKFKGGCLLNLEESFFAFDYEIDHENNQIIMRQDQSISVAFEARRLAEKYGKDTFNCVDLQKILNLGKNNVRNLLKSDDFPSIKVGGRTFVSALSLASWLNRE